MLKKRNAPEIIGLLMIKDEQDILRETLTNHSLFCDHIFVLDGTQGQGQIESESICRSFANVREYWTDDQTGYMLPLRDGARRFLLTRARKCFGLFNWYAILHGDELWGTNPKKIISMHRVLQPKSVAVNLFHFFPHISEQSSWKFIPGETHIERLSTHYMEPSIKEIRLFLDLGLRQYRVRAHSNVTPVRNSYQSDIVIKQYNYRYPEQAHQRSLDRSQSNWQHNHYQHLLENSERFFVESLANEKYLWESCVPIAEGKVMNTIQNPLPSLSEV